jgi:hypothetical protein
MRKRVQGCTPTLTYMLMKVKPAESASLLSGQARLLSLLLVFLPRRTRGVSPGRSSLGELALELSRQCQCTACFGRTVGAR